MKSIYTLFLVCVVVGFAMAQQEEKDNTSSKNKKRHAIGFRKGIFHTDFGYYTEMDFGKVEELQLQYAYALGKCWHIGARYNYYNQNLANTWNYNDPKNFMGRMVLYGSETVHDLSFFGSYEVLQKAAFIIRASLYGGYSLSRNTELRGYYEDGVLPSRDVKSSVAKASNNITTLSLFVDALVPINKSYEVGLSLACTPAFARTPYGIYVTANFNF